MYTDESLPSTRYCLRCGVVCVDHQPRQKQASFHRKRAHVCMVAMWYVFYYFLSDFLFPAGKRSSARSPVQRSPVRVPPRTTLLSTTHNQNTCGTHHEQHSSATNQPHAHIHATSRNTHSAHTRMHLAQGGAYRRTHREAQHGSTCQTHTTPSCNL